MSLSALLTVLALFPSARPDWVVQHSGTKVQFRGVSAVSPKVCWIAGSEGTFACTVDGKSWLSRQIPGLEKLDFRSIVAWDAVHAVLLSIGPGDASRVYRTDDGGKHWDLRFKNTDGNAFYDAIQFWDRMHGIALSDPVNGKFRILVTTDGGRTWTGEPTDGMPPALIGEGAFAASGTCLVVHGTQEAWFATGSAKVSRVFRSVDRGVHWTVANTPIPAERQTSGIFGLAFRNAKDGIAMGGDYREVGNSKHSVAVTTDGGLSWHLPSGPDQPGSPSGLWESAAFWKTSTLLMVGPNGVISCNTNGLFANVRTKVGWRLEPTPLNLHACGFAGEVGWAAGDGGLIVKCSGARP